MTGILRETEGRCPPSEGCRAVPSPSTTPSAGQRRRDVSASATPYRTAMTYGGGDDAASKNRSGPAARMPQSEDLDDPVVARDRIVEVVANPPQKDPAHFLVPRMPYPFSRRRKGAGKLESSFEVFPEGSRSLGAVLRPPGCSGPDLGFSPRSNPDGVAQPSFRARRSSSRAYPSMNSPRSICSIASESSSSSARDSRTGSPGSVARIMTCAPSGTNSAGISTLPSITVPVASFIAPSLGTCSPGCNATSPSAKPKLTAGWCRTSPGRSCACRLAPPRRSTCLPAWRPGGRT